MESNNHALSIALAVIIATSTLFLAGCGSDGKELTRSQAKKLLEAAGDYPEEIVVEVKIEWTIENPRTAFSVYEKFLPYNVVTHEEEPWQMHEKHGKWVTLVLTDAGRSVLSQEGNGYFAFRACEVIVEGVTGIHNSGVGRANVEYILQWANPTLLGDLHDDCKKASRERWNADFALYDDGWRMVRAN